MTSSDRASATAPNWQAVARDYRARTLSVPELCALHGVTAGQLYRRANREGWPKRQKALQTSRAQQRKLEADMIQRLLRALQIKMTELENRMTATIETVTAADSERDARTLNTLVRLFEKLRSAADAGADSAKSAASSGGNTQTATQEADRIRDDLARRIKRLHEGIPEPSEAGVSES